MRPSFLPGIARVAVCGLAAAGSLSAQRVSAHDLGGVPISVSVPHSNTGLSTGAATQLGARLEQVVSAHGMSGIGSDARFLLEPDVTVTRRGTAGELRAMRVVRLDVALAIRQQGQSLTFASTSTTLTGSGDTEDAAITDAIANLAPDDERLRTFIETGKQRIVGYYDVNCGTVIADARAKGATGDWEAAIALLLSVPREAKMCHPLATADAERLFTAAQARECAQLVRGARADAANREFDDAVEKLQTVDPSSPCAADADALIAKIETEVAKTEDRSFQVRLKSLRLDRETISKTLTSPARILERRRELTREIAVSVINRLPVKAHIPDR